MPKKTEIVKRVTEGNQIYNLQHQILVLRNEQVLLDFQNPKDGLLINPNVVAMDCVIVVNIIIRIL